jgi:hypothetical protein
MRHRSRTPSASWYHAVAQQEDDGGAEGPGAGLCICFNLWYEVRLACGHTPLGADRCSADRATLRSLTAGP